MLFFEKSYPAPACLEREKQKASGDYKCGDVLERLKNDFKNKCYICEMSAPTSINVEHFIPHQGDIELKFAWDNLFWSCAHCNNTKLAVYTNLLNCTQIEDDVEKSLKYEFKPFPKEKVKIIPIDVKNKKAANTCDLIEAIFNGTTPLKTLESANLRNLLLTEIRDFQGLLCDYYLPTNELDEINLLSKKIKQHLHKGSNFTSFKRWIIRDNEELLKDFGQYLTD
jgi:hypothetical protein